jgi:fatty acid synthase subunit alpha
MPRACRSATLCVRVVQSMAQRTLSQIIQSYMLVKIKEAPLYSIELEIPVLLNSLARASPDEEMGGYTVKQPR